ncbi:hypothetical protein [Tessaracoccus terricola]
MKLKRWVGAAVSAVMIAVGGAAVAAQPAAAADWSPQSQALCNNTNHCGIGFPTGQTLDGYTQGQPFKVNVSGRYGHTTQIRAFAVRWYGTGQNDFEFTPISDPVSVTLNEGTSSYGFKTVNVTVKQPPAGFDGHQVYVQTADFKKGNAFVGQHWTNQDSQEAQHIEVKTVRGYDKGFSQEKFNGHSFLRTVVSAYPGDAYSVQMLRGGKWVTIDDPKQKKATASSSGIAVIAGWVPDDLPTGKYRTRIVNTTRGISDLTPDQNWAYFTWSRTPQPGDKDFDVYTQEGTWNHNGRYWKTSCEPYSSTERCRTEIYATQVIVKDGKFYSSNDYFFNNLTYKPSPRSLWKNNPLGGFGKANYKGSWTADDGRKWRVECDTAVSGRNGCRAYNVAKVVEPYKTSNGATSYRVVSKEIFNNIVRFG